MKKDNAGTRIRIESMMPLLDERQKRLFLATEAKVLGYGGISQVSSISGVSRVTITRGIKEIENQNEFLQAKGRCRKSGGGRKAITETQPGIVQELENMIDGYTKGDPMIQLMWTSKSVRNLEQTLRDKGYRVSFATVSELLKRLGYSLQANRKNLPIQKQHPDRNEQFEYINEQAKLFFLNGAPVLSIDAKKKEFVGNFKNNGKEYHKIGAPTEVRDHDFPIQELGKATPYGIYDIFKNEGFVNVGVSNDTAEFAVESIRKWWEMIGKALYPNTEEIMITADSGGSNGYRVRLWKAELQCLANEIQKKITVLHFPPGTSKWNKIEHRLFSFISKNWRGKPLISLAVIVNLIGSTKTEKGLKVDCVIDNKEYKKGIEVSDEEFKAINIKQHVFHGEWNYMIMPQENFA
ncbi:MAG: ISAzo13 family transposase [Holosporaceae bacterium]|jgi:transposase|nr:ISAzo13 family transposase [Holosporaceae bacterium]